MVPHVVFYQLLVVALVVICLLIHVWWPDAPSASPPAARTPDTPRRKRSTAPKPFPGFLYTPLCVACEQGGDERPTAPGAPPIGAYLPLFPNPNATFMPPFAVGQDVHGLAVPARLAQWIPDALDAVDDCIESGVNEGDTPGDAPPTNCPAPAAAASPAPTRSPTNCSLPPARVRPRRSTGYAAMLSCFHATPMQ
jgi:hypothetical protein